MGPGRGGNWVGQEWPGVALLRLLGEGRGRVLKAETSPPGAFRPLWHWHWPRLRVLVLGVGGRKLHNITNVVAGLFVVVVVCFVGVCVGGGGVRV